MKWTRVLFSVISVSFILFCGSLINSKNANAQSINNFASIQYYYKNSTAGSYQLATKNNAGPYFQMWNPTTTGYGSIYRLNASAILPNSLKGSSFSGTGDIYWEITHDTGIDGGFYCPSLVEITVRPEQGTITSEQSQIKSCNLDYQDEYTDRYKISVQSAGNLSASTTITSFYIRMIGTEAKPIFDFTAVPNQSNVSVSLRANINFTMSTDPNTAVMGEINQNITNINNNIDEVNDNLDEVNDNLQNINDSITDPTVNGNFEQSNTLPAFGPVATIVNNIFDLPRVFLNPGQCQAVNLPLPFVNKNLPLTCPSEFMSPYQQIIVLVDTIASAYILYKTAVYTVRCVKKLRDPENEDEEYLDL